MCLVSTHTQTRLHRGSRVFGVRVRNRLRQKGSGPKRLVCRNQAAGRFRAPRGETLLLLPPRHSQTFTQARRQRGPRGIGSGCEIHSAREEGHDTGCIEYKTSARRFRPLASPARGCSGSKFFCAPGTAVQGKSSRAPSPARPSLTLTTPCSLLSIAARKRNV